MSIFHGRAILTKIFKSSKLYKLGRERVDSAGLFLPEAPESQYILLLTKASTLQTMTTCTIYEIFVSESCWWYTAEHSV